MDRALRLKIFRTACMCRAFEEEVYKQIEAKRFKIPIYLSAGQEFIAASLAHTLPFKPKIFAQHRGHSTYLAFGGDMDALIDELLGKEIGCAKGMGGSASIHSPDIGMYGHDGLMGTQVPIGVGYAYATQEPVLIFMGDASAEEDYVLGALGWAATKKLPVLFVVEDNNLSILTEKKVRRSWAIRDLAKAFGMVTASSIEDSPGAIEVQAQYALPNLVNISTNRLYWHSGAGKDSDDIPDRLKAQINAFPEGVRIYLEEEKKVQEAWKRRLEIQ